MPPLILASTSPRRRELLATLNIPFEVRPPAHHEPQRPPPTLDPESWAEALAYWKARSVSLAAPGRVVLGADTLVVCCGEILGKPRDADDARRMLELQAGRESRVVTGVAWVVAGECVSRRLARAVTRVWMRDDARARAEYVAGGDWWGKAGAYGIQDVGDRLVARIEGEFSNVVGLPLERVRQLLRALPA